MPFDTTTGIYTPPSGAEDAAPGQVIRSAIWNSIFTDISTALTELAHGLFVNGPRIISSPGSFTVHATDSLIYVNSSAPSIVLPLSATKSGPVKIMGGNSLIFGTNNSVVVFSASETGSGLGSITLSTGYQVITLYPIAAGGGYLIDG